MKTGWQQIKGYWYYLDQSGVMQNGWFKDNDKWYFLLPNGAMATSTVIDGRQLVLTVSGSLARPGGAVQQYRLIQWIPGAEHAGRLFHKGI